MTEPGSTKAGWRSDSCPSCGSHNIRMHPAMQSEGDVQPCIDFWHQPQHPFEVSQYASGRACTAMITLLDEQMQEYGSDCGQPADHPVHAVPGSRAARSLSGLRGKATSPEAEALEKAASSNALVRAADAAQYAREPIPQHQRGQIRVRLLNATPDPLGSIAALGKQYKGEVVRSLSEITDEERRSYLDDFGKTVLNGPLEAAQFHFQIEGVTRSITHQMVRSRASFFAQESLRFAVPEGNWADEIPLPPSLAGAREERRKIMEELGWERGHEPRNYSARLLAYDAWEDAMINAQNAYARLIELGMPAEEARGVLPHDMPTRIHWVLDLRTLLAEAGKRTCTQAQFPWRMIFAGMANALRERAVFARDAHGKATYQRPNFMGERTPAFDGWQFEEIAKRLRPVCFQTGSCGFMAAFDRSCNIRNKVNVFEINRIPPEEWNDKIKHGPMAIDNAEWAADPSAARS